MVQFRKPRVNFKAYRKPRYMVACFDEFGQGVLFRFQSFKRSPCPLCQSPGAEGRCFSWSFDRCSFFCHKCKMKGDALELVQLKLGVTVMEAAKWLEARGGAAGSGLQPGDGHA